MADSDMFRLVYDLCNISDGIRHIDDDIRVSHRRIIRRLVLAYPQYRHEPLMLSLTCGRDEFIDLVRWQTAGLASPPSYFTRGYGEEFTEQLQAVSLTGCTVLRRAVSTRCVKIVEHLLGLGVDPNADDSDGPAVCATYTYDILRMLLDAGADPNARNHDGLPMLYSRAHIPILIKLLLDYGADRTVMVDGRSLVDWCDGYPESRDLLLNYWPKK